MIRIRGGVDSGPADRPFESRIGSPICPTWTEGGAMSLVVGLVYGPPDMVVCMLVIPMSGGYKYINDAHH